MSPRDIESDRLLREIAKLWAEGSAVPPSGKRVTGWDGEFNAGAFAATSRRSEPAMDEPLSAEVIERIVDRVTALGDDRVASVQAEFTARQEDAEQWRKTKRASWRVWRQRSWVGASAAVAIVGVGLKLLSPYDGRARSALGTRVGLASINGEASASINGEASGIYHRDFQLRANTSALVGDTPQITVEVSAVPGSIVEIASQKVVLGADGRGLAHVELDAGNLSGAANEVVTLERAIAYSVAVPTGKVYSGELTVNIGVTPMVIEAPGLDTVTDLAWFQLAGRTTKGAVVTVAGIAAPVDEQGRFAQLLNMNGDGYTRVTVRAVAPGLAPRFASFKVERVQSLEREILKRRKAARPLAEVRSSIVDHVGSNVVVSGRVEEVRVEGYRTQIILQEVGECRGDSCLARLVYGGLRRLARGETITAIGQLQGAATISADGNVPEVEVSLLF